MSEQQGIRRKRAWIAAGLAVGLGTFALFNGLPRHNYAAPAETYVLYGIQSDTGQLHRYDLADGTLSTVGPVQDTSGNVLTGIEASAHVPGNLNIYGFWTDPADGNAKLVYINTMTGIATPVGQHLGSDPITGAVAVNSGTPAKWSVYAVQHVEAGLIGGHFDVDTSTTGGNSTDAHVHEYDDKHNVLGIDVFNYLNVELQEINEVVNGSALFKLITVNANLSPGATVRINGGTNTLGDGPYTLGNTPGATQVTGLKIDFNKNAIPNGGLVPTQTSLVRSNTPGANGEYRNGAFAVQAVALNADGSPAYTLGSNGAATSGLLWETTLFWHTKDPTAAVAPAAATGRLIRVNQATGAYESLMILARAYDSLAGSGGSGTVFLATSGSDLYRIDSAAQTETLIGSIPSSTPAMEFVGTTLMGATAGTTTLLPLDQSQGGILGVPINVGMSNLGTMVFVPLNKDANKKLSYD